MYPAWYVARRRCWRRASLPGGKWSKSRPWKRDKWNIKANGVVPDKCYDVFWSDLKRKRLDFVSKIKIRLTHLIVESSIRATSTLVPSRSYNFTTNSWILAFTAAEIIWGAADKHRSANVTSGFCCHTAHAVFFPFPYRADTVSQPVMLWKAGRAPARASPSWLAISCAGMYLKFFPVPNAIQSSLSSCRCLITEMAITTTSLSVVRNATFVNPLKVWSATCTNIRVSASSCVHGETEARFSRGRLLTTSSPSVDMICLPSGTFKMFNLLWYQSK